MCVRNRVPTSVSFLVLVWFCSACAGPAREVQLDAFLPCSPGETPVPPRWVASATGQLTGTIRTPGGAPVDGQVVLMARNDSSQRFVATAAPNGVFAVRDIPEGEYEVLVRRIAYKSGRGAVQVERGVADTVRIELPLAVICEHDAGAAVGGESLRAAA